VTNEKKRESRRRFLRRGLTGTVAALAALAAQSARAQTSSKMTQQQAGYVDSSTNQSCGQCTFFVVPDGCKIVQGPISETGTCIYFDQ
jgi:anaerobic selenocysteine-containing dehydrogenase